MEYWRQQGIATFGKLLAVKLVWGTEGEHRISIIRRNDFNKTALIKFDRYESPLWIGQEFIISKE